MKNHYLTYLTLLIALFSYSQTDREIVKLENQKNKIELDVQKMIDSINGIDIKIAQLKSKKFISKIKDSSLTAIARKGAKLKKKASVFADVITIFNKNKEVILLDYEKGFFEVCQGSLCGYMSKIWINDNSATTEFIASKETEKKYTNGLRTKTYSKLNNFKSSNNSYNAKQYNSSKSNNSTYKSKRYKSYRGYYRGPRGGCYYINSNGNKSYVSRSLCN